MTLTDPHTAAEGVMT